MNPAVSVISHAEVFQLLNTSRELYRLSPESGCASTVGTVTAVHTKEQVRAIKKKRVGFIKTSFDKVLL
jgi:hypothetical protein